MSRLLDYLDEKGRKPGEVWKATERPAGIGGKKWVRLYFSEKDYSEELLVSQYDIDSIMGTVRGNSSKARIVPKRKLVAIGGRREINLDEH